MTALDQRGGCRPRVYVPVGCVGVSCLSTLVTWTAAAVVVAVGLRAATRRLAAR